MRVLTLLGITAVALFASCAPRGALSPEDAYYMFRKALRDNDAAAVEKILSKNALARVSSLAKALASMNGSQRAAVAKELRVSESALASLTAGDYIALQLKLDAASKGPGISTVVASGIGGVTVNDGKARLVTAHGAELRFVKEDLYWKLDTGPF